MFRKGFLAIGCFLCAFGLAAQSGAIEQEFKERLERIGSQTKTIQCDFNQEKKVRNIRQLFQNKGQFYSDDSGRMALIYQEPKGDKVLMSGSSFTLLVGGKKTVSDAATNPLLAQIGYMMQACMSGEVSKLGKGWKVTVEATNQEYTVRLEPQEKRIQKYIAGMLMHFDKTDLTLNVLRIEERFGGYTQYTFRNKQLNKELDSSVFSVE